MTFKHIKHKIERPFVKTAHTDDGHYYITPDGKKYPSITTIFKLLDDKSWYPFWVESIMKKNKISQAEAEIECKRIGDESMDMGTKLHTKAEEYLNNGDSSIDPDDELLKILSKSLKQHLDEHIDNIHGTESKLYSDEMELAGTVDCVAEYDGVLSIIDFKNSRKPKTKSDCQKHNYFTQTTAYAEMANSCMGLNIEQIVIIVVSWDGNVKVFKSNKSEHEEELWKKLIKYEQFKALNVTKNI